MASRKKRGCESESEDDEKEQKKATKILRGSDYAFCTVCASHFSICHSGKFDIKRHAESKAHKANVASAGASSISAFFKSQRQDTDSLQIKVTKAEAVLCHFVAESNLPLSTMDKLTTQSWSLALRMAPSPLSLSLSI